MSNRISLIVSKEIYEQLVILSQDSIIVDYEDTFPDDAAGGNVDDAYTTGLEDGQVSLAKHIISYHLQNVHNQ